MFSLGAPALQPFAPVKTKIILYYGMNKVTIYEVFHGTYMVFIHEQIREPYE